MTTAAAMESYAIARERIYPDVEKSGGKFGPGYIKRMEPVVDGRIERAGVRLAAYLEQAFVVQQAPVRVVDVKAVGRSLEKAVALSPVN
jgi:hypothetical protein